MISSKSFYKHATLHHRISAKRSFESLKIYFTFFPSCRVWCSFKEPLPLYTTSFPMTVLNSSIICRLLLLLSNMVSPHLFSLSSQHISLGAQSKALLSRCLEGFCIGLQIFSYFTHF